MAVQPTGAGGKRAGQSLIEACLAIGVLCLVFFGMLQLAVVFSGREMLQHAAARGARAKTVGFNRWMVTKCVRVAAIPNAGPMLEPAYTNIDLMLRNAVNTMGPGNLWSFLLPQTPPSTQAELEAARVPEYLAAETSAQASYILDYADWDTVSHSVTTIGGPGVADPMVRVRTRQDFPLRIPLHRLFYAADTAELGGESQVEGHYSLYLEDQGL